MHNVHLRFKARNTLQHIVFSGVMYRPTTRQITLAKQAKRRISAINHETVLDVLGIKIDQFGRITYDANVLALTDHQLKHTAQTGRGTKTQVQRTPKIAHNQVKMEPDTCVPYPQSHLTYRFLARLPQIH